MSFPPSRCLPPLLPLHLENTSLSPDDQKQRALYDPFPIDHFSSGILPQPLPPSPLGHLGPPSLLVPSPSYGRLTLSELVLPVKGVRHEEKRCDEGFQ